MQVKTKNKKREKKNKGKTKQSKKRQLKQQEQSPGRKEAKVGGLLQQAPGDFLGEALQGHSQSLGRWSRGPGRADKHLSSTEPRRQVLLPHQGDTGRHTGSRSIPCQWGRQFRSRLCPNNFIYNPLKHSLL